MNISGLKSGFARSISACRKTLGRCQGYRLLAKCEREERRIRERVAKLQAMRKRAYKLIGGRGR